jgi:hypothetical protein
MGLNGLLTTAALLGLTAQPLAADPTAVLDNAVVRVLKTTSDQIAAHPSAVVVPLEDGPGRKVGEAYWSGDAGVPQAKGAVVLIEPKPRTGPAAAPSPASTAPPPKGLSFTKLFGTDRFEAFHGHMDAGTVEPFHTHHIDMVFVHLSGGTIEDTAEGNTRVNHWKLGDVEFEANGSSHSARNLGAAIDVVVVRIKP